LAFSLFIKESNALPVPIERHAKKKKGPTGKATSAANWQGNFGKRPVTRSEGEEEEVEEGMGEEERGAQWPRQLQRE
jgi:hypothetical protein